MTAQRSTRLSHAKDHSPPYSSFERDAPRCSRGSRSTTAFVPIPRYVAHGAHAAWFARRLHAGGHGARRGERREARANDRCGDAHHHSARRAALPVGAYESHENAAAARCFLDDSAGWVAAGLPSQVCGLERRRRAGAGPASHCLLEHEPLRFSVPEQGGAHLRRGQRDERLAGRAGLRLSRAQRRQDPYRDDGAQSDRNKLRQGLPGSADPIPGSGYRGADHQERLSGVDGRDVL